MGTVKEWRGPGAAHDWAAELEAFNKIYSSKDNSQRREINEFVQPFKVALKCEFSSYMYKEIKNGAVAKSYMTNGLLKYGEIFVHFLIY